MCDEIIPIDCFKVERIRSFIIRESAVSPILTETIYVVNIIPVWYSSNDKNGRNDLALLVQAGKAINLFRIDFRHLSFDFDIEIT